MVPPARCLNNQDGIASASIPYPAKREGLTGILDNLTKAMLVASKEINEAMKK